MGERSKKLGDHGEDIVAALMKLIGWKSAAKGTDLTCFKPTIHGSKESPRKSHGVDFIFSCTSPLEDQILKHILISSKFQAANYPNSPATKFKDFFSDLSVALECFKRSEIRRKVNSSHQGINSDSISGVLFWISGADSPDANIVEKISTARGLDEYGYGTIYVVDNYRASFLFDSIGYTNNKYGEENVRFIYPPTGKNINTTSRITGGKTLPPEYLNSGLLPFYASIREQKHLIICCQDSFDENSLKRLIGFSMSIALEYPNKVVIAFPDYDFVRHEEIVSTTKLTLQDKSFAESIEVTSYIKDFRGIEES